MNEETKKIELQKQQAAKEAIKVADAVSKKMGKAGVQTNADLKEFGTDLFESGDTNRFIQALNNVVGKTIINKALTVNYGWIDKFNKGTTDWGSTAKIIAVGNSNTMIDTPDGDSDITDYELNATKNGVYVVFIDLGFTKTNKYTITQAQLEAAFYDGTSFGSFITSIYGEAKAEIDLFYRNELPKVLAQITPTADLGTFVADTATEADWLEFMSKINLLSFNMTQPTSKYNVAVPARIKDSPLSDQVLIIRNGYMEALKTKVGPKLFNKVGFDNEIIKLDDEYFNSIFADATGVAGILVDVNAIAKFQNLKTMKATSVGSGLWVNNFTHSWKSIGYIPHENAVVLTIGTTTTTTTRDGKSKSGKTIKSNYKPAKIVSRTNYKFSK